MRRSALHRTTPGLPTVALLILATLSPMSIRAQDRASYAARFARAYDRLGKDLLIIRSAEAPASTLSAQFNQDPNFYYFTGDERTLGAVLVIDGSARRAELFLPPMLPPLFKYLGARQADASSAAAEPYHVDRVSGWPGFASYVDTRLAADPRLTIRVDNGGFAGMLLGELGTPLDSNATLANPYRMWGRAIAQRWQGATVRSDGEIAANVRAMKDSTEIATLRRVAAASAAAFNAGLARFAPGKSQREVEGAVVETCARVGRGGPSFWPWAMAGPNAVFPGTFASWFDPRNLDREMRAGEVARLDVGCAVDHYMGDVGRTVPVSGRFTPEQAEVIDLLVAAYRAGLAVMRDGAPTASVKKASVAEVALRQPSLRTTLGKAAAGVITRQDGIPFWQIHGVGVETAEELPDTLRAGMVLDYEPIFAVGNQGFYMEDMILVTHDGVEILTKGLPAAAIEIEKAMRRK